MVAPEYHTNCDQCTVIAEMEASGLRQVQALAPSSTPRSRLAGPRYLVFRPWSRTNGANTD